MSGSDATQLRSEQIRHSNAGTGVYHTAISFYKAFTARAICGLRPLSCRNAAGASRIAGSLDGRAVRILTNRAPAAASLAGGRRNDGEYCPAAQKHGRKPGSPERCHRPAHHGRHAGCAARAVCAGGCSRRLRTWTKPLAVAPGRSLMAPQNFCSAAATWRHCRRRQGSDRRRAVGLFRSRYRRPRPRGRGA